MNTISQQTCLKWHKVAELDTLPEGRVKSVVAGRKSLCLSHFQGKYAAMDNHCPHQGGPLGEGSIEKGVEGKCWIRCPWHGWDFDPLTGKSPGGHEDSGQQTFSVEVREDGIYVGIEQEQPAVQTASDVMVQTMQNWGVDTVFGMVGHSNLGFAEAIRKKEEAGGMQYFGVRHESAASFAVSGYGKLTGKPAACLSIAGPGATNMLTGLWDAKVDRSPALSLTGQVQTQVFGTGVFQEIDLSNAFAAVSAFNQVALPNARYGELMSLALKTAIVQRDVANVILPDEVQVELVKENGAPGSPTGRRGIPEVIPTEEALQPALTALAQSKRPIIIVGYGALWAMDDIIALAEELHCPVLTTFKAKGQIPDTHPLAVGVLGRSGTPMASWFMNGCDLQLVFGASFSVHTGIERKKTTIQVDFEQMALGRFHAVDFPIWGEVAITARIFRDKLKHTSLQMVNQRDEVAERRRIWLLEKKRRRDEEHGRAMHSAHLFEALSTVVPENAVVSVDVGNNTYSFGRYFETKEGQRILMSGYLGSIGFSFPAAMGAWAATQSKQEFAGRPVFSVSGDGGFGQYLAEFTTAVKYNMNITHILLNNSELGKISKEQIAGNWEVWQTSLHNPSFADYATLCGGFGIQVYEPSTLISAIKQAVAYQGPAIVECITDAQLI